MIDHLFSGAALLIAIAAGLRAHFHSNARKAEAEALALDTLGKKYAALGWAYAAAQPDSASSRARARQHAVEGFVIADTTADGKRDFTDKQVGVYVDAARPL